MHDQTGTNQKEERNKTNDCNNTPSIGRKHGYTPKSQQSPTQSASSSKKNKEIIHLKKPCNIPYTVRTGFRRQGVVTPNVLTPPPSVSCQNLPFSPIYLMSSWSISTLYRMFWYPVWYMISCDMMYQVCMLFYWYSPSTTFCYPVSQPLRQSWVQSSSFLCVGRVLTAVASIAWIDLPYYADDHTPCICSKDRPLDCSWASSTMRLR